MSPSGREAEWARREGGRVKSAEGLVAVLGWNSRGAWGLRADEGVHADAEGPLGSSDPLFGELLANEIRVEEFGRLRIGVVEFDGHEGVALREVEVNPQREARILKDPDAGPLRRGGLGVVEDFDALPGGDGVGFHGLARRRVPWKIMARMPSEEPTWSLVLWTNCEGMRLRCSSAAEFLSGEMVVVPAGVLKAMVLKPWARQRFGAWW